MHSTCRASALAAYLAGNPALLELNLCRYSTCAVALTLSRPCTRALSPPPPLPNSRLFLQVLAIAQEEEKEQGRRSGGVGEEEEQEEEEEEQEEEEEDTLNHASYDLPFKE